MELITVEDSTINLEVRVPYEQFIIMKSSKKHAQHMVVMNYSDDMNNLLAHTMKNNKPGNNFITLVSGQESATYRLACKWINNYADRIAAYGKDNYFWYDHYRVCSRDSMKLAVRRYCQRKLIDSAEEKWLKSLDLNKEQFICLYISMVSI